MKIRNGWVSNSSSSSFLVAFPKRVQEMTVDELRILLFGDAEKLEKYDYEFPTEQIAQTVYDDAVKQEPFVNHYEQEKEMLEIVSSGYFEGYPEFPYRDYPFGHEDYKKAHEVYYKVVDETASRKLRDFVMHNWMNMGIDPLYYVFSYGDDNSYGSVLEHGNIFANLPHMRISHH